ncbi:MAG: transposase [Thermoplasmatales archaeon]|nr:transposase [Thermoplasmatales archaeon]
MRAWYPPEDADPIVLHEPNRKGISVFGAVRISDGSPLSEITEKYNALTLLEFLSLDRKRFPDCIFVLDNALYHHASLITDYAYLAGIDLLFPGPDSPELTPIERVLTLVKKHATHNRYFQLLSNLRTALSDEFNRHLKPNKELRNICVVT